MFVGYVYPQGSYKAMYKSGKFAGYTLSAKFTAILGFWNEKNIQNNFL